MEKSGRKHPGSRVAGVCFAIVFAVSMSAAFSVSGVSVNLSEDESLVISLVNPSRVWQRGMSLEEISWDHPASRIVGSAGNAIARDWLVEELGEMGLDASVESVPIPVDRRKYIWNITTSPVAALDLDGRADTMADRVELGTARANYGSLGTNGTTMAPLVVYPLPESCEPDGGMALREEDRELLASIDPMGKAVMFPVEFRRNWTTDCFKFLMDCLSEAVPAFCIAGPYHEETYPGYSGWSTPCPQICVRYEDAQRILTADGVNASILLSLDTEVGGCEQAHNVVARLSDNTPGGPRIIVGAHYDTVQTPGLVDNSLGVAAALEIGRIFAEARSMGVELPFDLDIILFDGEEFGLLGSEGYVDMHEDELKEVLGVIVFDCIGLEYDKYHLSPKNGGQLSPYARFPVLRSEREKLLEWGLDANSIIETAAADLGQRPIPMRPDKAWRSDHSSFSYHVPAVCLSSGILSIDQSQHSTDMPWVHSLYVDSYTTADWADQQDAADQLELAVLTIMRMRSLLRGGYTPGDMVDEIRDDVEQLADETIGSVLAQRIDVVISDLAQQDYVQSVKRAEIISCVAHLQSYVDRHPQVPASSVVRTIIDAGISSLGSDVSAWYQRAINLRSERTIDVANRIANTSKLLEEARTLMTETDAAAASRYLDISMMSLCDGYHDKATEFVQKSEEKIHTSINQGLLLSAMAISTFLFSRRTRRRMPKAQETELILVVQSL